MAKKKRLQAVDMTKKKRLQAIKTAARRLNAFLKKNKHPTFEVRAVRGVKHSMRHGGTGEITYTKVTGIWIGPAVYIDVEDDAYFYAHEIPLEPGGEGMLAASSQDPDEIVAKAAQRATSRIFRWYMEFGV